VKIATLTPAQEKVFDRLQDEISQTHYRWLCFKQIFVFDGEHRERHEARYGLMTQLAPVFFLELREVLADSVILQLCRVTERTEQKVKRVLEENVVIGQLRKIALQHGCCCSESVRELEYRYIKAIDKCEEMRQHRNKRISHLDLRLLLESFKPMTGSKPTLQPLDVPMVDDALDCVADYVFLRPPLICLP
jgi:hypothetical protein